MTKGIEAASDLDGDQAQEDEDDAAAEGNDDEDDAAAESKSDEDDGTTEGKGDEDDGATESKGDEDDGATESKGDEDDGATESKGDDDGQRGHQEPPEDALAPAADEGDGYGDPAEMVARAMKLVLPECWEMHVDEGSGYPWFYCEATNESQWDPPDGAVDEAAPPPAGVGAAVNAVGRRMVRFSLATSVPNDARGITGRRNTIGSIGSEQGAATLDVGPSPRRRATSSVIEFNSAGASGGATAVVATPTASTGAAAREEVDNPIVAGSGRPAATSL